MARKQRSIALLLVVALVAVVGAALFSAPSVAGIRALLSWEDDLRPKAGEHNSDDNDYKLIEINTPAEELAKFSVNEFNERRLGPRVSLVSFWS